MGLGAVIAAALKISAFFLALGFVLMWVERQNKRSLIAVSLAVFGSSIPLLWYFFRVLVTS